MVSQGNSVYFYSVLTFTRMGNKTEIKHYVFFWKTKQNKTKPQLVGLILYLPAVAAAFLNIESVNSSFYKTVAT